MVAVNQILRVANKYLYDGLDEQINVFHLVVTATTSGDDTDALNDVADFIEAAYTELIGTIPDTTLHAGASVFNVSAGGPIGIVPPISAIDGTSTQQGFPPQNAPLLLFPTAVSRVQGRMYLPTPDEGSAANGVLAAGYVTAANAFAVAFKVPFVGTHGTTLRYRVVGSTGNHLPTGSRLMTRMRTQRRRTAGRGS